MIFTIEQLKFLNVNFSIEQSSSPRLRHKEYPDNQLVPNIFLKKLIQTYSTPPSVTLRVKSD